MHLAIPVVTLLALAAPMQDRGGDRKAAAVAPVVGEDVAVVVHLDLAQLDAQALARRVLGDLDAEDDEMRAAKAIDATVDALRQAGAKDLFLLLDVADQPGPPLAAVPLAAGADGLAIGRVLTEGVPRSPLRLPASETIRGVLVAGAPPALARLRAASPAARPELAAALASGSEAPIQVAVLPNKTQRRVLEESFPTLPPQLGGGPITTVSRGLSWASLALDLRPRPMLRAVVQARDAEGAKALARVAQDALGLLGKEARNQPELAGTAEAIGRMKPEVTGDRITVEADLDAAAKLVALPIRQSREAARRAQCVNNLKQIALAMHNHHAAHNSFPPAFSTDPGGKPLLSWRVHVLPYLEQKALYDQFHLDEPWDSPHNKALISRMPAVYACPSGSRTLAAEGRTSYLVPRGPATIFPGSQGIKIQEITDGTSNTLIVVDAGDEAAVPWTKPADWQVPAEFNTLGIFGHHPGGTNFAFGDGSVRFLRETIAPAVLQALTTRNGGEVISSDSF